MALAPDIQPAKQDGEATPERDPLDDVTLDLLQRSHPERELWLPVWSNYRLLYKGGEELLRSAGQGYVARSRDANATPAATIIGRGRRQRRFLHQFVGEPDTKYVDRWERSFYIGYIGAILDYFVGWLFTQPPVIAPVQPIPEKPPKLETLTEEVEPTALEEVEPSEDEAAPFPPKAKASSEPPATDEGKQPFAPKAPPPKPLAPEIEPPEWWSKFLEDCNGGGLNLIDFARDAFRHVMICRRGGWLVGKPSPEVDALSEGQAEEAGLDNPVLTFFPAESIIDWQRDSAGKLEWIVLHKEESRRVFPNDRVSVETFTYADRTRWRSWQLVRSSGDDAGKLVVIGDGEHGLEEVPFVELEIPEGLWATNKLASWQIDLFNKLNVLSYGQILACYPQPFIRSSDPQAANRVFGEGVLLQLRAAVAEKDSGEEFGWVVPDVAPWQYLGEYLKEQRDEGYRIIHQMSLAVDSQAVGAVARSGASKVEDRKAAEIILGAYGGYVREALIKTANLISKIKGDDTEWTCTGFDNFQVSSLDEELATAALVATFDIKSRTFKERLEQKIATGRVLDHLDEATKETIRQEISQAYDQQEEMQAAGVLGPDGQPMPQLDENGNPIPPEPALDVDGKPKGDRPDEEDEPVNPDEKPAGDIVVTKPDEDGKRKPFGAFPGKPAAPPFGKRKPGKARPPFGPKKRPPFPR